MTRRRSRSDKVSIGFMILWLTLWAAGMLLAVVAMGGAALNGEPAALVFLAVWLAAAGFGLYNGARRLLGLMTGAGPARRPPVNQPWHDGMTERPKLGTPGAGAPETPARTIPAGRAWSDGMPDQPPPPPGRAGQP
jgi:hypothetical protein